MSIPYVGEQGVSYGVVDSFGPLVHRIVADNPSPFTYWGTGTYIVGRDEPGATVAVIDPGPWLDAHMDALLHMLDGKTVSHILVTHTHADHSLAAPALSNATGAPTYGYGPHGGTPGGESFEAGVDRDFAPEHMLADGDTIEGDGWTIEAIHTPGHTSNHLCYALAEENLLFSGDHIMGWSTTVVSPPDGDMTAYMDSLAKLRARNFAGIRPTHGPLIADPDTFIDALANHRLKREQMVLRAVQSGTCKASEMVPIVYDDLPTELHSAAASSVLAHLIKLAAAGSVIAEGPMAPDTEFRVP